MLWLCADLKLFVKSVLPVLGSLEMDSPSQPVNNHHVHSHTTVESKPVSRDCPIPIFLFQSSDLLCVFFLTERKYSAPAHHTTEHVPEKKFKSEALLSTLTSDASKENTPGKTHILTPLELPYKNMSGTIIHWHSLEKRNRFSWYSVCISTSARLLMFL